MSTPVLDLDLLKAFVAVADLRSFTRAAASLNRTQSAVSVQIRRLEDRLQMSLFERSTARVALTPAGEALIGYARRILALNDEAIGRLGAQRLTGRVRLGVMEDYGALIMPALLAAFVASFPAIDVEMETGLTAEMPDRLGEAFDLVVAMHPEGQGNGQFLRREQPVWAASPDHLTQALDPLPVALYPQGCLFRRWAMQALDAAHRPWRLAFVSHSQAAVEAIVAQGLAVTVVKAGVFPQRLRRLTHDDGLPALPEADIRLHRAQDLSPAAALLADHIVARLARPA